MALVLAIEPDARQAEALRRVVQERVRADLVLVDSKDAAVAAIDERTPDLVLVTALWSPQDDRELFAHLRALADAAHLQTLTIPLLAPPGTKRRPRRLLGPLKRKRSSTPVACDHAVFAEGILNYLERAREVKAERAAAGESDREARATESRPAPEPAPVHEIPGEAVPDMHETGTAPSEANSPVVTADAPTVALRDLQPTGMPVMVVERADSDPETTWVESPVEPDTLSVSAGLPVETMPQPADIDRLQPEVCAEPFTARAVEAPEAEGTAASEPDVAAEPLDEVALGVGEAGEMPASFDESTPLDAAQQALVDDIFDQVVEADSGRETDIPVQLSASTAGTDDEQWLHAGIGEVSEVLEQVPAREESSELPQLGAQADSGASPVTSLGDADLILAASAMLLDEAAGEATDQELVVDLVEPEASAPLASIHAADVTAEGAESESGTTASEPASPTQDVFLPDTPVRAAPATSTRRLAPLAIWARQTPAARVTPPPYENDLRGLLSRLGIPSDVASVAYPRGCRIRRTRIRVRRAKRRKGETPEPVVILSKSALGQRLPTSA